MGVVVIAMKSLASDIVTAVDLWLQQLTLCEETINKLVHTRQRVQQILLQMKYEGELNSEIQEIGVLWVEILSILADRRADTDVIEGRRKELVEKILLLLELEAMSRELAYSMITHVYSCKI